VIHPRGDYANPRRVAVSDESEATGPLAMPAKR
jgi:hypothetical protein